MWAISTAFRERVFICRSVNCVLLGGLGGVRCGAQVQLPVKVRLPAQLPGRNSNSTGSAKSLAGGGLIGEPPRRDVALWHIASSHCAAEFGRYRGIADFGEKLIGTASTASGGPQKNA